ncbi:MAG: hypothetical protein QOJ40_2159, partial [Verrucomicrobiota bacterium]
GFPFAQLDDNLVPFLRWPADVRRRRHGNIMSYPWVIRDDIKKVAATSQSSDEPRTSTFQDADDPATDFGGLIPSSLPGRAIHADQHMVPVHCGRSGILRNSDRRELWIIGLKESDALPVHPNAARHQIGIERERKPITLLYARDLAAALQLCEHALDFSLVVAAAKLRHDLRSV